VKFVHLSDLSEAYLKKLKLNYHALYNPLTYAIIPDISHAIMFRPQDMRALLLHIRRDLSILSITNSQEANLVAQFRAEPDLRLAIPLIRPTYLPVPAHSLLDMLLLQPPPTNLISPNTISFHFSPLDIE
jgi:hypothetical protein